ncbi:enoyl-CoA hydratase [Nitrincola sp. A-D6]|uniref:enoyl-CoA hydratase/isomerase family protein n=1 Tax=Nitrincola sp. A-D6 TaxID=1545442 RepID=UPI00051FE1E1|nr:enoyl-CoA hydratase/isomerase family protein [Nitrincola sp. A-D6]KGK41832.1 enoyl-CoA hydratase [Nitrincola sp. A-D6]
MSCVLFIEHPTAGDQCIAEIRLNAEKSLNALTLDMIDLMLPQLQKWRDDPRISAVFLDSAGEKAFCAGGDVVKLYRAVTEETNSRFPEDFFTREYQLDYALHTYPKPVICWGSGIVMGGGMGLLSGCSHRVVTETSYLAMPEVTIGLYPDVGGSWFLNRMPGHTGLFLGLTGNPINAADALFLGLGDRALRKDLRDTLMQRLQASTWQLPATQVIDAILRELEAESAATFADMPAPIKAHQSLIRELMDQDSVAEIQTALQAIETDDKWVLRAQKALQQGSPVSVHMIARQLAHCRHLSLKEVFQQELNLSVQCCRHREFPEGVRALLVDKDNQPQWTYASVEAVEPAFIDALFESPWSGAHPLQDL